MTSIPRPRTVAFTAITAMVVLILTGCAPEGPPAPTIGNAASDAPPFGNESDALSSARATYESYLRVTDQIISDGGSSPERLDEFVADDLAATEKEGFQDFADHSMRSVGSSQLAAFSLQSYDPKASPERSPIVVAYACVDISEVDVVNANGRSVVAAGRPNKSAFEVEFELDLSSSGKLRVAANEPWAGAGVC
jgi:hypothetical protein